MNILMKSIVTGAFAVLALGLTAASADHNDRYKPAYCDIDHDHRSHDANYYDYYAHDRYYRAGPYRGSGVSFSVRFGDGYYNDRRNYDGRRHGYRGRSGRIVNKQTYPTRYRARIVLIEEIKHRRRGPRLVCTVEARGPEAHYVPTRRLHRIANRECSPRARVRVYS